MNRKFFEATFILIDLSLKNKDEMFNYFYKFVARSVLVHDSQDFYKLAFIGSRNTSNELNFKNLKVVHDWKYYSKDDFISYLSKVVKKCDESEYEPGNIFEGIHLACYHLENDSVVSKCKPKRIILLSDLCTEQPGDLLKSSSEAQKFLSSSEIWLYVLGPSVRTPLLASIKDVEKWQQDIVAVDKLDHNLSTNLRLMKSVINNGLISDFYVGWNLLWVYKPQVKPPYPWYSNLTIGNINIPINVIKYLADEHKIKFPDTDEEKMNQPEDEEILVKNPDTGEVIENAVRGYKIKGRCIVIPAENEKQMAQRSSTNEGRCLEIKYFVDSRVVSPFYWKKRTLCCVIPDTRGAGDNCWSGLDALSRAMAELNVAAVCKRIYNKGPQFRVKPHILMVCPKHGPPCLLLVQWVFQQDILVRYIPDKEKIKTEPRTDNKDIKSAHDDYLNSITISKEDYCEEGKIINCLAPHLAQNPIFENQLYTWVVANQDPENKPMERCAPEFKMNPILQERCQKPVENFIDLLQNN